MTLRELLEAAGQHRLGLAVGLVALPLLAWLLGLLHGSQGGGRAPWRYLYSLLVYAACVPGILAALLTAYTLLISRESLLDVDPLVYFAPAASMVVTLVLIRKRVPFDEVPGFDRLSGLMVLIAASFAIAFALERMRILVIFGSSIKTLFGLALLLFLALKWGSSALLRRRGEPRLEPPPPPG